MVAAKLAYLLWNTMNYFSLLFHWLLKKIQELANDHTAPSGVQTQTVRLKVQCLSHSLFFPSFTFHTIQHRFTLYNFYHRLQEYGLYEGRDCLSILFTVIFPIPTNRKCSKYMYLRNEWVNSWIFHFVFHWLIVDITLKMMISQLYFLLPGYGYFCSRVNWI